jgi:argininosuccinate lyase
MTWHPTYRERVLAPDYGFAAKHLKEHFLDALVAHARTVATLPQAAQHASTFAALETALAEARRLPPPAYDPDTPDLYYALQRDIVAAAGDSALGWLRLGLSRNDLDMTVYRLRARDVTLATVRGLLEVQRSLLDRAEEHVDRVMVAYTHHQPGQPTTVAHYLAAVASVVERDVQRSLQALERLDLSPMGAAALAGSSFPLDRHLTARLLGFAAPVESTYDAVASSDWQVDVASTATSVAIGMSRFLCDLIGWTSLGLVRLPDGLTQGSSIMPQKRNPVALEHARTRFSRALGAAQSIVLSSHNIPYGDLNDFGPDVQGALQTLHLQLAGGLALVHACLEGARFDADALERTLERSDVTATDLADELVRISGRPFQEAHRWVADLLAHLAREGRSLRQVVPADLRAVGGPEVDDAVLRDAVCPSAFVARRQGLGGPAVGAVRSHLAGLRERAAAYSGSADIVAARIDRAQQELRRSGKDT